MIKTIIKCDPNQCAPGARQEGAAADFRVRLVDCGGRFVLHPPEDSRDDFGFINERLMPDRVHMSPAGYAEWDACLNADV